MRPGELKWSYLAQLVNITTGLGINLTMPLLTSTQTYAQITIVFGVVYLLTNFYDSFYNVQGVLHLLQNHRRGLRQAFENKIIVSLAAALIGSCYYFFIYPHTRQTVILLLGVGTLAITFPTLSFLEAALATSSNNRIALATRFIQAIAFSLLLIFVWRRDVPANAIILAQGLVYGMMVVLILALRGHDLFRTQGNRTSRIARKRITKGRDWLFAVFPTLVNWGALEIGSVLWDPTQLKTFRVTQMVLGLVVALSPTPTYFALAIGNVTGRDQLRQGSFRFVLYLSGLFSALYALFVPTFLDSWYHIPVARTTGLALVFAVSIIPQTTYWLFLGQILHHNSAHRTSGHWLGAVAFLFVSDFFLSKTASVLGGAIWLTVMWGLAFGIELVLTNHPPQFARTLLTSIVGSILTFAGIRGLESYYGAPENFISLRFGLFALGAVVLYGVVILLHSDWVMEISRRAPAEGLG